MFRGKSNAAITFQLLLTILLWGGNNVGVKYQVRFWPPIFTASTRLLCAGWLLIFLMRKTGWPSHPATLSQDQRRRLWTHGGVSLALYISVFVWSVSLTSAQTVALFMGTSPVWALVWEERFGKHSAHRYVAAGLALAGVVVLFLPSLKFKSSAWLGNSMALGASILWTMYSRQCRALGGAMSGLELTGQTFWRAGLILIPLAAVEVWVRGVEWNPRVAWLQGYAVVFSGLLAFGLWNNALQVWPTSRVFLFGNLIPVTTMAFAYFCLGDPITANFWTALGFILAAVLVGQTDWRRIITSRWWPGE